MSEFNHPGSELFIPDDTPQTQALSRTTHLGIGAHADDLEGIAIEGILECYRKPDRWFCGVVVTDGAGSPRSGPFEDVTEQEMIAIRKSEQKSAAQLGEYGAQILLNYPSTGAKHTMVHKVIRDLRDILSATTPRVVYTHNLFDKHPTHLAVAVRVIQALQILSRDQQPQRLIGGEFWRDLDWLPDRDKVIMDCSNHRELQRSLLEVFDSQIQGGKQYHRAILARRQSHATFLDTHRIDRMEAAHFALDLTPLIKDPSRSITDFMGDKLDLFRRQVLEEIRPYLSRQDGN